VFQQVGCSINERVDEAIRYPAYLSIALKQVVVHANCHGGTPQAAAAFDPAGVVLLVLASSSTAFLSEGKDWTKAMLEPP
jgi:hypothetical protein